MGVSNLNFDRGMIERALSRSGGTALTAYAYGPELPQSMRNAKPTGKKVGHVYIHVKGSGDSTVGAGAGRDDRSLFVDTQTAIAAIVEIMTHQKVKDALARLDQDPQPNEQEWIHAIPVSGHFYGYARAQGDYPRKISTVSINMRSHGDALFISSCYPDGFLVGPNLPPS
ncbi:hypothetical protein R3X27_14925 [Tropicimonas sp. TH_r6]|uniref:hypothetical protein n=1 Tax=Tropicimonas sp. TH_r6 TaxID=3082085 RepID=UPI002955A0F9|nr:hypothetical protein [Tropicimonas sp. TH_r6]MDV7143979.1 hypothetical protein [Tropicimonas sp. TH_r6]